MPKNTSRPEGLSHDELLRLVERTAPVGIAAVDLEGRQTYVNAAFCELVGWPAEALVGGFAPYVYWPADNAADTDRIVAQTMAGRLPPEGSAVVFQHRDGHPIDVLLRIAVLHDDYGRPQGWVGSIVDITRQKRFERELTRLAGAITATTQGIAVTDAEDRFVYANEAAARLYGIRREDLIGHCWHEFVPPDHLTEAKAYVAATLHHPGIGRMHLEIDQARPAGTTMPVDIECAAIRGSNGAYLGHIVHLRDLSETRRAADERLKLRKAIEASGEAVFLTDRDGVFTYVNPEFTRLYGHAAEDVVGKVTPRILKSGMLGPEIYAQFWATILSKQVLKGELVNKTKAGKSVHIDGSVNPVLGESGEIIGFLAIQRDVTERKQLAAQLVQSQKMEAVGRLAGGVAHDFNNLLSVVLSYADFALDGLEKGSALREDIAEIRRAGERAAALTRQLLVFSRRETARPEIVDVNSVLGNLEKLLRRTIGEDVALLFDPSPDLPYIHVDRGHLEQVVMNLAVNARDAMPQGGQLVVSTANIEVSAPDDSRGLAPGRYALIDIADSGCGMPPEVLARAFDPFFTTKLQGKGTGLGLSIVYGVVQQAGGQIAIDSEVGRGTSVKVYLPASTELAGPEAAAPELPDVRGSGELILLVEDEDAVRILAHRILLRGGYRVLEARNAGEALLQCERYAGEIHALITDVVLPQLSGVELAVRLRAMRPKLPILLMSGHAEVDEHGERSLGKVAFLRKPLTRDGLLVALGRVLARHPSGVWTLDGDPAVG